MPGQLLHSLLRHDCAVAPAGLAGVVVIAWLYLPLGAGIETETVDMGGGQMMTRAPPRTPGYVALIFLMWAIMSIHKAT
jgi:hypothetical protein